jgi:hypothetical protein
MQDQQDQLNRQYDAYHSPTDVINATEAGTNGAGSGSGSGSGNGVQRVHAVARALRENIGRVIVGKANVIDLLLMAILAEGHVLIEDVPGIGKTMLARALAICIGVQNCWVRSPPDGCLHACIVTPPNFNGAFPLRVPSYGPPEPTCGYARRQQSKRYSKCSKNISATAY